LERLKRYKPAYITGEVPNAQRQLEIQKFQTDDSCKVFIGTIGAAGTGITLTAADTVIFVDLPFTYSSYSQACDRAHRVGQKNNVTIIKMMCIGTIDERIAALILRKKNMSELLVDGKAPRLSKQDLLYLLS